MLRGSAEGQDSSPDRQKGRLALQAEGKAWAKAWNGRLPEIRCSRELLTRQIEAAERKTEQVRGLD